MTFAVQTQSSLRQEYGKQFERVNCKRLPVMLVSHSARFRKEGKEEVCFLNPAKFLPCVQCFSRLRGSVAKFPV